MLTAGCSRCADRIAADQSSGIKPLQAPAAQALPTSNSVRLVPAVRAHQRPAIGIRSASGRALRVMRGIAIQVKLDAEGMPGALHPATTRTPLSLLAWSVPRVLTRDPAARTRRLCYPVDWSMDVSRAPSKRGLSRFPVCRGGGLSAAGRARPHRRSAIGWGGGSDRITLSARQPSAAPSKHALVSSYLGRS